MSETSGREPVVRPGTRRGPARDTPSRTRVGRDPVPREGGRGSGGRPPPARPRALEPGSETTLRRGLDLMFALGEPEAAAEGGLGVVRLAELVGREKGQVSRTLRTLESCEAVERDSRTLRYRLGWRLLALAVRAGDQRLVELAGPWLLHLVHELAEAAHLSVLRGAEVVTVLSESASRLVQVVEVVGEAYPAYCTSSGRVLLADRSRAELEEIFAGEDFSPRTPSTPTDLEDLVVRLAAPRVSGCVVVADELEVGLLAVAAPVRVEGRTVAALNVSGPDQRLRPVLDRTCRALSAAAAGLTAELASGEPAAR